MARPKWMQEKSTRKRSAEKEKKLAKDVSGRLTVNSGATFRENDVVSKTHEFEHKLTSARQFTVKLETWDKLKRRTRDGREPVLVVEFETGEKLCIIDYDTFISHL